MRISDWSSDVCSSDLATRDDSRRQGRTLALLRNACGRDTLTHVAERQRGLRPTPRPASCRWTTFEEGARPMAIYHLAVKSVSRSTGRSAVAAVAYRAGVALENERDGLVHAYTRRSGVEGAFIGVPEGGEWALDRAALWIAARVAENGKDGKVLGEEGLGLPAEDRQYVECGKGGIRRVKIRVGRIT